MEMLASKSKSGDGEPSATSLILMPAYTTLVGSEIVTRH